jgi:hypothetical protein
MSDQDLDKRFFTLYPNWDFQKHESEQQPFHWFASSYANWQTGTDLFEVLKGLAKRDKDEERRGLHVPSANVFWVPLSDSEKYQIRHGQPDVEGLVYIGKVNWPKPRKKKGQKS